MVEPKKEIKEIKVCLTNRGEDNETPWAYDLGPAGPPGSRKVRLVNVPFMHAKPTWGDTIVVSPRPDGPLTWDRDGVPWKQISTKIVEDGGRWAMIIDYVPDPGMSDSFEALVKACDALKVVCERAWVPRKNEPGRAYLAVQKELTAEQVMARLGDAKLPLEVIQIHPEPRKRTRASTQTGISDEAGRPPADQAPVVAHEPEGKKAKAKPAAKPSAKAKPPAKPARKPAAKKPAAKPAAKKAAPKPAAKKKK